MTLKEFFIAALAAFETDASKRVNSRFNLHTAGMCDALCEVSIRNKMFYDEPVYIAARNKLEEYAPPNASAYWFPIHKEGTATQDECILPRRAILKAIIDSL